MIDSHAHLTCEEILCQVDGVIDRAGAAGVETIVTICTDEASLKAGLDLSKRRKEIVLTAATTPHDVEKEGESFFPHVQEAMRALVAIGETGLDYFYERAPRKLQQRYLTRYLDVAKRAHLPMVFHCRDAFEDLFAIADEQYRGCAAALHCFTGTREEAKGCLDRGWYLSFAGMITYKKSEALREVAAYVPIDRMLVETDTPFLAPQSRRGRPNEPSYLPETVARLARVKGVSDHRLAEATSENARRLFRLSSVDDHAR